MAPQAKESEKASERDSGDGSSNGEVTGLEELRQEIRHYLSNLGQGLLHKAGGKVTGLTGRLTDMAEGQGGLAQAGSRMLHGENPVKALVSQKAKDAKDNVVGKVKNAFGGGGGGGKSSTKATNIVEFLDVGVPVRTVYDHWTQFEEFSSFTKGVQSVSMKDETESDWNVKVGPSSRSWKATVQEQVPDDRIVWTSEGAKGFTHGAVSFHELAPSLTRIVVVVEYYPAGFFEKTGNLWRAQGRRLRLDLKHFGRYVTLAADEEVEGWRGEIRDGEVVRTHEEGLEDDEDAEGYDEEDEQDVEDQDEAEGETGDDEDDEDWDEDEAEDEGEDEAEDER